MSGLVRGTEVQQRRTLVRLGGVLTSVIAVVVAVVGALPEQRPPGTVDLVLSTPTVGQGIIVNSHVMLRGVNVGSITSIERRSGVVDLGIRLNSSKIRGLTDSFGFDFRPANSFGVSALSLTPRDGGALLVSGRHIDRSPDINATMSELLNSQIGMVSGVLDDTLVQYIRRAADYTTALAPLIETGLVLTNMIAQTQQQTPGELIDKLNAIMDPVPDIVDFTLTSMHQFRYLKGYEYPVAHPEIATETLNLVGSSLFGSLGGILDKQRAALTPIMEIGRAFADAVTAMVARSRGSMRLDKVLAGLNEVYGGSGKRAVKFRLLLEPLPVFQSAVPLPANLDEAGPR